MSWQFWAIAAAISFVTGSFIVGASPVLGASPVSGFILVFGMMLICASVFMFGAVAGLALQ